MSNDALALRDNGALVFNDEQRQMIRDTFANGASDGEFAVLMEIARARRLNPLLRQVHFVEWWDSEKHRKVWAAQVSIDGLRAIAQRTGLYQGQDEPEFVENADGTLKLCKVRAWRRDWPRPAVGVAYWAEYVQTTRDKQTGKTRPTAMWARMPHVMLAKVAEAIALRKAFPEDMAGLYTGDEMAQSEVGVEEQAPPAPPSKPRRERAAANDAARPSPPADPDDNEFGMNMARDRAAAAETEKPSALVDFLARVAEVELPGEAVAVWMKHRAALEALTPADREDAWSRLVKHTEAVGRMKNAAVWLKKAVAEEDARRTEPAPAPADAWMAAVAAVASSAEAAAAWANRPEDFRAEPAQGRAFDALASALHAANAASQPKVTLARVRNALATKLGYALPPPPDGTDGARGAAEAARSSSKAEAADAPAGDAGPAALAAWQAHIAAKPRANARDAKGREAELCEVASSYLKRADAFAAAGLADEALDACRAELRARGCGDPDALITAIAHHRRARAA